MARAAQRLYLPMREFRRGSEVIPVRAGSGPWNGEESEEIIQPGASLFETQPSCCRCCT